MAFSLPEGETVWPARQWVLPAKGRAKQGFQVALLISGARAEVIFYRNDRVQSNAKKDRAANPTTGLSKIDAIRASKYHGLVYRNRPPCIMYIEYNGENGDMSPAGGAVLRDFFRFSTRHPGCCPAGTEAADKAKSAGAHREVAHKIP
jgi:hypothetical protein